MEICRLSTSDPHYPAGLRIYLGESSLPTLTTLGSLDILQQTKVALFCSSRCPAGLISQAHDWARQRTQSAGAVISGFHSPVEKECLRILLDGGQPIIVCPARSLVKMRIRKEWRKPLDDSRLVFLSAFPEHRHRSDAEMAFRRNRFVAALAERVFVPYASPASKTESLCKEVMAWRKPLYTLESEFNGTLKSLGVKSIRPDKAFLQLSANKTKRNE